MGRSFLCSVVGVGRRYANEGDYRGDEGDRGCHICCRNGHFWKGCDFHNDKLHSRARQKYFKSIITRAILPTKLSQLEERKGVWVILPEREELWE